MWMNGWVGGEVAGWSKLGEKGRAKRVKEVGWTVDKEKKKRKSNKGK
jgi:hypothetical protein